MQGQQPYENLRLQQAEFSKMSLFNHQYLTSIYNWKLGMKHHHENGKNNNFEEKKGYQL